MTDSASELNIDFETVSGKIIHPSLESNRSRFPILDKTLSSEQESQIKLIKQVLLKLPLLHKSTREISFQESIKCSRTLGIVVATGNLDQSLGLDKFVYLSWGPIDYIRSRDRHYLVTSEILMQPNVVVTQGDITDHTFGGTHSTFKELPSKQRKSIINNYYGRMLTGQDWLELTARQVLQNHENGEKLYTTYPPLYLGEVKIFGEVNPEFRLRQADTIESRIEVTKRWFESGFAVHGPNTETIEWMEKSRKKAESFWNNLLNQKNRF